MAHTAVVRLRRRHVAIPVGSLDANLPLAEIDVAPFEQSKKHLDFGAGFGIQL